MKPLTKRQSVALAVALLGGAYRPVDIEDVAIKASELAPSYFRWRKYPDQVDLEKVRLCAKNLLTASTPLLRGSVKEGWMLTPEGADLCRQVRPDVLERGADLSFKRTDAWRKFQSGHENEITVKEVRSLLRIDEYSSIERRRERILNLVNTAVQDAEAAAFVSVLRNKYPEELSV